MLITICVILATVLGIIFMTYALNEGPDWLSWTGLIATSAGGLISLICIFVCVSEHIPSSTVKTLNSLQHKRAGLIARYESCNQSDDLIIISEIEDFNAEIENRKYDLSNPWYNWFVSPAFNEIETIDRNELNRKPLEVEIKENNT